MGLSGGIIPCRIELSYICTDVGTECTLFEAESGLSQHQIKASRHYITNHQAYDHERYAYSDQLIHTLMLYSIAQTSVYVSMYIHKAIGDQGVYCTWHSNTQSNDKKCQPKNFHTCSGCLR